MNIYVLLTALQAAPSVEISPVAALGVAMVAMNSFMIFGFRLVYNSLRTQIKDGVDSLKLERNARLVEQKDSNGRIAKIENDNNTLHLSISKAHGEIELKDQRINDNKRALNESARLLQKQKEDATKDMQSMRDDLSDEQQKRIAAEIKVEGLDNQITALKEQIASLNATIEMGNKAMIDERLIHRQEVNELRQSVKKLEEQANGNSNIERTPERGPGPGTD